jgi:hypothetical protein
MRVILGADLHGSERSQEELEWSITLYQDAITLAEQNGCRHILWLGDLVHYKYGLSAKLLLWWSRLTIQARDKGILPILLRGNHDTPWISDPEQTVLELVQGAALVTKPRLVVHEGVILALLPWYPPEQFRAELKKLAVQAIGHNPCFLMSHVSLAEGVVSISNRRVESPIRLHDLRPDVWDHIFLGDYHAHQTVGDKVTYLGAPRPTTFGDFNCKGLFLLEVVGGTWFLRDLELPTRYPKYVQHRLTSRDFPILQHYDPRDKHTVEAPLEMHRVLKGQYPGIVVKPLKGERVPTKNRRLGATDILDPWKIYQRWLAQRGLDHLTYDPHARRLLEGN